jgi:serine/threonine protein kinase
VKFYEIGVNENGIRFVVMEKLEGESLAEVMDRRQFSEIEGIYVVQRLLKALLVVHQANLIHRDLKPANIFVCRLDPKKPMEHASNVKLLDFGIVKDLSSDQQITATNIWVGTPKYMSPEAFDPKKSFCDKSDLYSIGILLYRFVSGEFPFFVKHPALPKHYTSLPAPVQISWLHLHAKPADLQHPLNPLIQQLLAKKPEDRPNTAEVLKILEQHYDYIPNVVDFFSETIADDLNFDTTVLQRMDLNLIHDVHLKETVKLQRPVALPTTSSKPLSMMETQSPPQAHQIPKVAQTPSLSELKIIPPPKSLIEKIITFFRSFMKFTTTDRSETVVHPETVSTKKTISATITPLPTHPLVDSSAKHTPPKTMQITMSDFIMDEENSLETFVDSKLNMHADSQPENETLPPYEDAERSAQFLQQLQEFLKQS